MLGRGGVVCSSVASATQAGSSVLQAGGNAIDAAIATAAALCVVEPLSTGIGGDAFVLLWSAEERRCIGLNGSGRAPSGASLEALRRAGHERIPERGIHAATVPGAVHAWTTLHERHGRLPFAELLAPAIRLADEGFPVSELVAFYWMGLHRMGVFQNDAALRHWAPGGETPAAGSWFRAPGLARTLRQIADGGARAFYEGEAADAIVATSRELGGGFLPEDLATHESTWVEPISRRYRDAEVVELPPNGQGLAALQALGMLDQEAAAPIDSVREWHRRIEAIKVAFADRGAHLADPDAMRVAPTALLDDAYLKERAALVGERARADVAAGAPGDTIYCCAADRDGNLVSFIQSLFHGFGSGVGCGDTGIVLQNRGAGFVADPDHPNALGPGKRPFHTIIPAMLLRDEQPWIAFGVMGGDVQPQGHVAFVGNRIDHGLNIQEALDRPRFRFEGGARVAIEAPQLALDDGRRLGEALTALGHEVEGPGPVMRDHFGGGQAIERLPDGTWAGASDRRKDGCAIALPH